MIKCVTVSLLTTMPGDDPDVYLAILKASYDYEPQSDDEIAIKEDQLLLLVERVDDEWWKVKIKAPQESESPIGLVPAAYVEQAEHTSVVRALYDYDPTAPGELSLHEDDVLYVFDTEDDWLLVQNSKEGGHAGYVPGNYVEVVDENEPPAAPAPTRIIVPDSPPRPVSTYVDPADRVAQTRGAPAAGDDIQTWSVSEIDKKGKKKKGTLGIGNGAVFFASESDKTPVQKWQTKDVSAVSSEKSKHVRIDIDGPTPTSLHFHAGSKDNADAIMAKLESSKALSSPSSSPLSPPAASEPTKKASVHFSSASPVIIPEPDEEIEDEELVEDEEPHEVEEAPVPQRQHYAAPPRVPPATPPVVASAAHHDEEEEGEEAVALYDFTADGDDELSVVEGERLAVLEKDGDEWWKCRNAKGKEGVVPASYLEAVPGGSSSTTKSNTKAAVAAAAARTAAAQKAEQEAERALQEVKRKEEEAAAKAEADARKAEAQAKAKQAALASEIQRQARAEAAANARVASPPADSNRSRALPRNSSSAGSVSSRTSTDINRPPPERTRVWHDRSGQFRVEAAFLGFNNGKLRLHKVNGVIVEVPSEKMSLEDMRYVERFLDKNSKARPGSAPVRISEGDIPLALGRPASSGGQAVPQPRTSSITPPQKKGPKIDWFDFFLSAGCDLDDCTRYAASFERDKIDETLLVDITEGTMRSLGLREGDIIRVKKAIDKRKPGENLSKPSAHLQEQLRRDEELARQLQAQENGGTTKSAPHLFTEPGGTLKPRRGRPQPKSSVPLSAVDIKAIASAPVQRTASPQLTQSPGAASSTGGGTPVLPARPASAGAAPLISGFDDDAWTNRPSSTKPVKAASPAPAPLLASTPAPAPPIPTVTVPASAPAPAPSAVPQPPATTGPPSLAKTTESDIFEQLAKLSVLRQNSTPAQPPQQQMQQPQLQPTPSPAFNVSPGMGMGPSPVPMGQHFLNPPRVSPAPPPPQQQQPYIGPRGPFAPVPANQSLLQPLIPVPSQPTGFNTFIPTKPPINGGGGPFGSGTLSAPPAFLSSQPTGFMGQQQPIMSQPTGFNPNGFNPSPQPLMSQPTGAFGAFGSVQQQSPFQNQNGGGFGGGPIQSQMTGFNPPLGPSIFGPGPASPPPLPSNPSNNTSPANIFAQMKSGTFANDNDNTHGSNPGLNGQTPVWGQTYQGYTGY
ncbi:hypothetical protein BDN70DRAFT_829987 [Pholiota conissans]|uniref:Actin cytoskeleton-regulatory complex protein SLA1 n=1 Tax=Pholiota conissans TaxID=109636 RepID=A0A9P5Z7C7_9AGAR|nr:hypothetical protein BDN70DRAFT_829987 [Pholiota conissans]